MKSLRLIAAVAGIGMLGSMAWAQTQKMPPQDFAATAASSDMFEIQSSEMALQKSQNVAVKDFARMMIKDHTTASKELKMAAQQDGVEVPTQMMEKHAAKIKALSDTPTESFDAVYIDEQVGAHEEGLMLMTAYAQEGDSPALKSHAEKSAPIIQTHLEHVKKLDKK